ncbi:hypothetical protein GCM10023213_00090 [Prosthecobacter algae]|uniref:Uncharacterized protein n=1 Tax=Prosthecobacter algae TaxID=1144682 RepID=A0ABP9NR13_9BACT
MKAAAIILCSIQIIVFFVIFAKQGMPDGWELAFAALMILCPLVSVWALMAGPSENSLFSLWIQRKKLEQRAKIKELEGA